MDKKTFTPFDGQIEIVPLKKETAILGDGQQTILEAGEVVSVGKGVTFFKAGDIAHFEAFGCSKTIDYEGKEHYVVVVNEHVIRGKHARE